MAVQRAKRNESKRISKGKPAAEIMPLPIDGALLTVGELLAGQGVERTLSAFQGVSRRRQVALLGSASKDLPLEAIANCLVVNRADLATALGRDDVLVHLLEQKAKLGKARVHSFTELANQLPGTTAKAFKSVLGQRWESKRWPEKVGVLQGSQSPHLFLLEHVIRSGDKVPSVVTAVRLAAANGEDFARDFNNAFDRLRRQRPFNLVELSALRQALPEYTHDQFDHGLLALRKSHDFILETFEGRHGTLSAEEMAATIRVDGRLFAFASRRDHG